MKMFKRKCSDCGEKVDRKFGYCPYCGNSLKIQEEQDSFGMLGHGEENDFFEQPRQQNFVKEMGLPMGLDKIMNSLMKKIEKDLSEMQKQGMNVPSGFKIHVSTGRPQIRQVENQKQEVKEHVVRISQEEMERRGELKRVEAKSQVRRFGDNVVYEILVPGVRNGKDIVITKIEEGIEIRAYSKDKCYVKTIPLKLEITRFYLRDEKLTIEMRG